MRTCVIFNPTAKGNKARNFRRHLNEFAADSTLKQTTKGGHARELAAEAVGEGFEIIVAAGGDGTLNEVLNGIGDADGFDKARLGLLPLGTVNVFAREVRIPTKLESAWEAIRQGHEATIDLGVAEYSERGAKKRRYFAQMAGAGLDARAIELVNWPLKKRIGPLAYVAAGLQAILERQPKITVNDGQKAATGELVLIGNGALYGGDFKIFPRADLRDGLVEGIVFPKTNLLTLARCGPGLLLNQRLPEGVTNNFQSPSLTLTSKAPVPFEVDGELAGTLPVTFSVERSRLRVMVPQPQ